MGHIHHGRSGRRSNGAAFTFAIQQRRDIKRSGLVGSITEKSHGFNERHHHYPTRLRERVRWRDGVRNNALRVFPGPRYLSVAYQQRALNIPLWSCAWTCGMRSWTCKRGRLRGVDSPRHNMDLNAKNTYLTARTPSRTTSVYHHLTIPTRAEAYYYSPRVTIVRRSQLVPSPDAAPPSTQPRAHGAFSTAKRRRAHHVYTFLLVASSPKAMSVSHALHFSNGLTRSGVVVRVGLGLGFTSFGRARLTSAQLGNVPCVWSRVRLDIASLGAWAFLLLEIYERRARRIGRTCLDAGSSSGSVPFPWSSAVRSKIVILLDTASLSQCVSLSLFVLHALYCTVACHVRPLCLGVGCCQHRERILDG